MKDKLKQRKIMIIALAVMLTLTVGYAIFSNTLNINGTASTGSTNFNIVFDRVGSIREVEASNTTAEIKESGKKLEINVPGLSMPTAYAIIPVTIKNKGDITAKVKEIRTEGLDTTDIKVTYDGLAKEDIFNPNDEKEVNIKVIWDRSTTSTSVEASFSIEIIYEQVASGSVTTTTSVVDSRFVYEGTKLVRLTPEGAEYFKNPENTEIIIPEGTTEIGGTVFLIPTDYPSDKIPDYDYLEYVDEIYSDITKLPTDVQEKYDVEFAKFQKMLSGDNPLIQYFVGKTLRLPSTLEKISYHAFYGLQLSGNLTIPNGVKEIEPCAFAFNKFTGDLVIPNSVTEISTSAFTSNAFSGTLTLSSNLTRIGPNAFVMNNFTGNLVIPNSITKIGAYAFGESGFTGTLTLPNGITKIEEGTFYKTGFIGELYIPDSVTNIDYEAFWEVNNITSVSMPAETIYRETATGDYNPSFPADVSVIRR